MTTFLILLISFLLLVLIIIWHNFLRKDSSETDLEAYRDDTNVQLYHEHKAEIEDDYQQGKIDQEHYQYLLSELNKGLLQDVDANQEPPASKQVKQQSLSILWPIILTLFVVIFSIVFYAKTGAYKQLTEQPKVEQTNQQQAAQQAVERIKQLIAQSKEQPDNSDNWYQLGQMYVAVGEFNRAVGAFDQILRIEGAQADIYGAQAQARFYQNNQTITPQVQALIDQALALDPLDPATNILLGMNNFLQQNYQQAINSWQKVINSSHKDVNRQALIEAVAEAEKRLQMSSGVIQNSNDSSSTTADIPELTVEVTLSPEIQAQIAQGDNKTVFVYAIPNNGMRMPVAALKINSDVLPATVVLNDARAMSPQMKLSGFKQVNLFAVISQDGSAGIKPGDFKGELKNVDVANKSLIQLIINDKVVK